MMLKNYYSIKSFNKYLIDYLLYKKNTNKKITNSSIDLLHKNYYSKYSKSLKTSLKTYSKSSLNSSNILNISDFNNNKGNQTRSVWFCQYTPLRGVYRLSKSQLILNFNKYNNFMNLQTRSKIYNKNLNNFRFQISGRLNGVRMARKYMKYNGKTATQTWNKNTDYILKNIYTKWGVFGLKIWSNKIY